VTLPAEGTLVTLPFRTGAREMVVHSRGVDEDDREYVILRADGLTVVLYADAFYQGRLP